MALYEGLKPGRRREDPPESAWRRLEARTRRRSQGPGFLDSLLGEGSSQALGRAVGKALAARRRAAPPAPARPAFKKARVQALGSGQAALPRGRKGVIRGLLLTIGLIWAALALRPWQNAGALHLDIGDLIRPHDAEKAARKQEALRKRVAEAEARLAGLPLELPEGRSLALWQASNGRWFGVREDGLLLKSAGPAAPENLGLVTLRGLRPLAEERSGKRRLRLVLPSGTLKELLPLKEQVASESAVLDLGKPGEPVLITHAGVRCLLPTQGFEQAQERLAMVLADLSVRKRRAATIDLRFDESAIVRTAR